MLLTDKKNKRLRRKYKLVTIINTDDSYGQVRGKVRQLIMRRDDEGEFVAGFDDLRCHGNKDFACSSDCAAIQMVDYKGCHMLLCLSSYENGIPLGILDEDTTDLNIVEFLRWGSDWHEQWAASKSKGGKE